MSRGAAAELTRRLRVSFTGGAGGVVFYNSDWGRPALPMAIRQEGNILYQEIEVWFWAITRLEKLRGATAAGRDDDGQQRLDALAAALTCVDSTLMQQKSLGWLRWQADGSVRM